MTTAGLSARMPSLFVSHGAPTLALADTEAHRFLRSLPAGLPRPEAIVVVSAHFDRPVTTITAGTAPETIHDFGGFPRELYDLRYPAPGSPALAQEISALLASAGWPVELGASRGFDHGAWIPLFLMYPDADIPLVQVSLDSTSDARRHWQLGRLLRPLRDRGVLLVGSGGTVHNLRDLDWRGVGQPADWAAAFNAWLHGVVTEFRDNDVLQFRSVAPDAARSHPTNEHFLPLPFALGTSHDGEERQRVHHSWDYGNLAMDMYRFGDARGGLVSEPALG